MGVNISYDNKYITCISGTNFLDLIIDEKLSWKNRIDQLLSKLSSACHAHRTAKVIMVQETLKDDLFFLCTLYYDLWYNILGQLTIQY